MPGSLYYRAAIFKKGKKGQILKFHFKYNSEKNFDKNWTHIASIAQV